LLGGLGAGGEGRGECQEGGFEEGCGHGITSLGERDTQGVCRELRSGNTWGIRRLW
jgi:hypothetical protein